MSHSVPTPTLSPKLPTPAERPGADVVIYDGHCRFCRAQSVRLARWDRGARLAYLALQDPEVARRWPGLTHDALMKDMHLVDRHGGIHRGAGAVRYLSRRLPWLWWLAPAMHIPGSLPVWQYLYRQFARRRYLLGRIGDDDPSGGCDNGTCAVHFR